MILGISLPDDQMSHAAARAWQASPAPAHPNLWGVIPIFHNKPGNCIVDLADGVVGTPVFVFISILLLAILLSIFQSAGIIRRKSV